jgi:hypothetical protein
MGKSLSRAPKKSASVVSLISVVGVLSSLLLYIPSKIGIVGFSAYAQHQPQQPQQNSLDQISSSLEIVQSKVQTATAPGAWGHGVPSLYNISSQDLLTCFVARFPPFQIQMAHIYYQQIV